LVTLLIIKITNTSSYWIYTWWINNDDNF